MSEVRPPDQVRKELREAAKFYVGGSITKSTVGAMIGRMTTLLGGHENRRAVMGWIFRGDGYTLSRGDTNVHEWLALYNNFGFYQDDGAWKASPTFEAELIGVLKLIQGKSRKNVKN